MSEFEDAEFPEYIEMTPMKRYYNDVNVVRENLTSAIMLVDTFAQAIPIDQYSTFTKMLSSDLMPMEWEMENDIVIAKEKLAILPLHAIADDLENSDCDPDDLKEWYRESLRGIRMVTNDIHTDECLKHTQAAHSMCDFSTTCPRRFSQRFLLRPAISPDFTKDIYKTAPKREFMIVKYKLDLAMIQGVIGFDDCENIREKYCLRYNNYMSKRAIGASDVTA